MSAHSTAHDSILMHLFQDAIVGGPKATFSPKSTTESLAQTVFFPTHIPETEKFASHDDATSPCPQPQVMVVPKIVITPAELEMSPPSPELSRGRSQRRYDLRLYLSPTSSRPVPSTVSSGSPGRVTQRVIPQALHPHAAPRLRSRSGRASESVISRQNASDMFSPFRSWWSDLKQQLPGFILYLAACLLAYVGIPIIWAYFTFTGLPK